MEQGTLAVSKAATIAEFPQRLQAQYISGNPPRLPAYADMRKRVALKQKIEKQIEQTGLSAFPPETFYLSGAGHTLEHLMLRDLYAPPHMQLGEAERTIMSVILESLSKLREIATRIGKPGAVEDFQREFGKMESRVNELSGHHRPNSPDETAD